MRLFRGFPDGNNSKPSFLSYDGLYKVTSFWAQKGGSGFDIYQFAMNRLASQGPLHDREVCDPCLRDVVVQGVVQ